MEAKIIDKEIEAQIEAHKQKRTLEELINDIENLIASTRFGKDTTDYLNDLLLGFKNKVKYSFSCPISLDCFSVDDPAYTILTGDKVQTVISLKTKNEYERTKQTHDPITRYAILGYEPNIEIMASMKKTKKKLKLIETLIKEEIENPSELERMKEELFHLEDREKQEKAAADAYYFKSSNFFESGRRNIDYTKFVTGNKLDLSNQFILNEEVYFSIVPFLEKHREITILNLHGSHITSPGAVRALAKIRSLDSLDLSGSPIGDVGAQILAKNTILKSLNLSNCNINNAIPLSYNKNLKSLDLSYNFLQIGVEELAENTTLKKLNLCACSLVKEELEALAENTTLIYLDASRNKVKNEGAKILAKNKNLSTLILTFNEITEAGAKALAENTTLIRLGLSLNSIRSEGAAALAKHSHLEWLDVSMNNLGGSVAATALAQNTKLKVLNMFRTFLNSTGTEKLAKNENIRYLDVGGNNIGVAGAKALAQNNTLECLYICGESVVLPNIGVEGAKALAQNNTLTILGLDGNRIEVRKDRLFINVGTYENSAADYKEIEGLSEVEINRLSKAAETKNDHIEIWMEDIGREVEKAEIIQDIVGKNLTP
ncbi:TPA: hypothetical protein ACTUT5_002494 [Legionella anisa]|uniref:hypothetical protein n=1 Tax=Legionella anisa TaxID=28082 RepID=UPI00197FAF45|nr:hypothetical protein [Legionella anisa]MBN5934445.1 hypothetical protein [Legionella anisa]